ncbi:hypothetical protein SteCoe_14277 [Stentor coeruleus]|uniref:Uncharacterized protein n=1 Tax=Stentor coeruleus TaxID=5963 RepID=A0A1R2C6F8_9CILI|nr:hypothetical protein SteCoe_14277 [Stentor coeruleus]
MALKILSNEIQANRLTKGKTHSELGYITNLEGFLISFDSSFIGCSVMIIYTETKFVLFLPNSYPERPPYLSSESVTFFPSLADGRDLLPWVLDTPWSPSVSLFEIVTSIPKFISKIKQNVDIGAFYLGYPMSFSTWQGKEDMNCFSANELDLKNPKNLIERTICISHSYLVILQINPHICGVGNIVLFSRLSMIKAIKTHKSDPEIITINFRDSPNEHYIFRVPKADDLILLIKTNTNILKNFDFEIQNKPTEERLTQIPIYEILRTVKSAESFLAKSYNNPTFKIIMEHYQKAIEFYSAANDPRYNVFLRKLQTLLSDSRTNSFSS